MSQCKQSAQEFIQNAFSPMVAVLCNPDAELVCQKNNLSFVELIQPFCRLTTEAHIRDPGNMAHSIHQLRITVRDMTQHLYQPTLAKKLMNESVANAYPANMENPKGNVLTVGDYDLQISSNTPWFESYRECFLQVAYPSDHEFVKHFLSCIFVVSSSHPDPMEQFTKLSQQQHQQQHQSPGKPPKWFSPNTFKYYVLLHDVVEGEESKAEAIYQSMKSMYGAQACHLLQINSRTIKGTESMPPGTPDPPGALPDPWSQFIKKPDETSPDMEASIYSMKDTSFPSQLNEASTALNANHTGSVETATEVIEEPTVAKSSPSLDHPLAQDDSNFESSLTENAFPESDNGLTNLTNAPSGSKTSLTNGPGTGQHGVCLTLSDHDRLRIFVHEYLVRGLIPWAERMIRNLNEQVSAKKKPILFRKWFGGSRPADKPTSNTTVVYTPEAPEMQLRRLADLAFMFQLYEIAYQSYHSVKKDFNNDHAYMHNAGALEMASLSVFMQGTQTQRQYPTHYIDLAITTYLSTCKTPQFATRATLMSTEALKSKGMYAEAAMQFIKMTSEDSDLRSALLLEQAAHCFINMKQPMVRKYAFHMILAGHRFSKAGQRRHALRSYQQALQVYKGKDWTLAEDHINFTVGRQSFNLKLLDNASAALRHLLTRDSQQTPTQQSAFLKEYLFVYKQHLQHQTMTDLPQLPLPSIDGNTCKVLLGKLLGMDESSDKIPACSVSFSDDNRRESWESLEEKIVLSVNNGSLPITYKHTTQCYTNMTNNGGHPLAVMGEHITVEVTLVNPLAIPLVLTDIVLLWKFLPHIEDVENQEKPPQILTNEQHGTGKQSVAEELIETEMIAETVLDPREHKQLHLSLLPNHTGDLHILGLAYSLGTSSTTTTADQKPSYISSISVRGKQTLDVQGPRLNGSKPEKCSKMYGPDRRLDVRVLPRMPLLQVCFSDFPQSMSCGEVQMVSVHFTNRGSLPLRRLHLGSTQPAFFTFGSTDHLPDSSNVYQVSSEVVDSDPVITDRDTPMVVPVPIPDSVLKPGASVTVPMWIHGPRTSGTHHVDMLFHYEPVEVTSKISHRVLRHTATIKTSNPVSLTAVARRQVIGSKSVMESLLVTVEVENMNRIQDSTITEISVLQVSCVSPEWVLEHLSTKRNTDLKLNGRESMMMCFKATRCEKCKLAENKGKVVFSNVTFDQHQICSSVSPCRDFCLKCLESQKQNSQGATSGAEDGGGNAETPKPLSDLEKVNLALVVLWKGFQVDESGNNTVIQGQHHVFLEELDVVMSEPPLSKVALEQPPVKIIKEKPVDYLTHPDPLLLAQLLQYYLQYTVQVTHQFEKSRVCLVPVTLLLHNNSKCKIKVLVSSRDSHRQRSLSNASSEEVVLEPQSTGYTWTGQINSKHILNAGETKTVNITACFCMPGVYNLNTLQVAAGLDQDKTDPEHDVAYVAQKASAPAVISISEFVSKSN